MTAESELEAYRSGRKDTIAEYQGEMDRLRAIEAAAQRWRTSLADDGWTEEDILSGMCRPGMVELMRLLRAADTPAETPDASNVTVLPVTFRGPDGDNAQS